MDVILVITNLFKFNVISIRDFPRNVTNGERYFVRKQGFTVFDGKDNVVVGFIDVVVGLDYGHSSSLVWKPRVSKLSYIVIAAEPRGNPLPRIITMICS